MSDKSVRLNYNNIIENYTEVLSYAGKFSSSFSFITSLKKPYSKIPPNCVHDDILTPFIPYLMNQNIGIKHWPGTITRDNHKVMNTYCSCKKSRALLLKLPNVFIFRLKQPEDICFYRGEKPWFITISHEKISFLDNPTEADISFFQANNIEFWYN